MTYEFQVPTNPATTPEAIAKMAFTIASTFFGDGAFELRVDVRGGRGNWEAWATATREFSANGASP
jgi:hypothetical protein